MRKTYAPSDYIALSQQEYHLCRQQEDVY
jgi:hypothetical protein